MTLDARNQLIDAIAASGITPPSEIIGDGNIHRFSSNGKRGDKAGWYVFYRDGAAHGAFGCWRLGFTESFRTNIGREFTKEENAAYHRRLAEQKRIRDKERETLKREARAEATEIWNCSSPAPNDHPYLVAKGVEPYGLKISQGNLVVPLRIDGELHSLQFISECGDKWYQLGGRVRGCYHAITFGGTGDDVVCIAEGYATSATIHRATGFPVVVAFNVGQLVRVASAMRTKFPKSKIVLCADDDFRTTGNPGIVKGREAARAVGGVVAIPQFPTPRGEHVKDFNDMAAISGLESVREAIGGAVADRGGPVDGIDGLFEHALQRIGRYRLISNTDGRRRAVADCPLCIHDEEMGSLEVVEDGNAVKVTCLNGCEFEGGVYE